ncbi:molecular chaperone HtpG [Aureibacter tunicatorum]|uniref:Chaperone protein HtpG n=1 Tax=Aureibacter tunicatorum TaxID=866807 RepID=A0AAE3XJQ7_9BACT|nr:molecular chaperone HtpG [Aureibacter tunicatorum]MDR6237031.1 molecular chaperone HtpG [Aureibacter tunicatorum]BDD06023.1 chaperone protein HtpG [Aureibacter tunicatorum]
MQEQGSISIHTENIFPIIKKFLYSDHEIFLRELVSNAVDATQKLAQLASMGSYQGDVSGARVEVKVDKEAKTITISDQGLGMTGDEVKKYINQIAFSGATEFVEKYKDKGDTKQMIGMFGLGFYSAFMVAKEVEIITKSYQEGAEAVKWTCDGSTSYSIEAAEKSVVGTDVILHVADDSEEFLEDHKISEILNKYCKFLPVEIKFGTKEETEKDPADEEKEIKVQKDNIINNPNPIWTKSPSDLTDEDYLSFYRELYPMNFEEPLFWIHLNVDYPFNLTGILYFPKVKNDFEVQKNHIQLYSKQVFITDEVKGIVPEFLQLLHGVIDSPDIPLNVSRSFLQADNNVKKINNYITKKVADKLSDLFKSDRKAFEEKWDSIGLFVKYGMITEEKFYDKAIKYSLLENVDGEYFTIDEYKDKIQSLQKDKNDNVVVLYANDPEQQHGFIQACKERNYDVVKFDAVLDSHFINALEQKLEKVQFKRVDADTTDKLIEKEEEIKSVLSEDEETKVKEVFEKAFDNPSYTVTVASLSTNEQPLTVTMPEFMRRMRDMAKTGGGGMNMFGAMPDQYNATVNANHALISKLLKAEGEEEQVAIAKQVVDLALLAQNLLTGEKLTSFINRSVDFLAK